MYRLKKSRLVPMLLCALLLVGCHGTRNIPGPVHSRGETEDLRDKINALKSKVKAEGADPQLLGLAAFIQVIQNSPELTTGDEIIAALDADQPDFKVKNKTIYESLSQIDKIYNRDGVVYITTKNQQVIRMGKLNIENASSAKVVNQNGQVVLQNVNGLYGKALFKFYVNTLTYNTSNGDIKAELSVGKKNMNLKRDILKMN